MDSPSHNALHQEMEKLLTAAKTYINKLWVVVKQKILKNLHSFTFSFAHYISLGHL